MGTHAPDFGRRGRDTHHERLEPAAPGFSAGRAIAAFAVGPAQARAEIPQLVDARLYLKPPQSTDPPQLWFSASALALPSLTNARLYRTVASENTLVQVPTLRPTCPLRPLA